MISLLISLFFLMFTIGLIFGIVTSICITFLFKKEEVQKLIRRIGVFFGNHKIVYALTWPFSLGAFSASTIIYIIRIGIYVLLTKIKGE